jgi:hypothetical protein
MNLTRGKQRAGEKPLEIFDAAGYSRLVANGTQYVVGEQKGENIKPSPAERAQFGRAHVDQASDQPVREATRVRILLPDRLTAHPSSSCASLPGF